MDIKPFKSQTIFIYFVDNNDYDEFRKELNRIKQIITCIKPIFVAGMMTDRLYIEAIEK